MVTEKRHYGRMRVLSLVPERRADQLRLPVMIGWPCSCRPIVATGKCRRTYKQVVLVHGPECASPQPALTMGQREWRREGQRVVRVGALPDVRSA